MKYVIEHMEPQLFDWCILEYEHMSRMVGKENLLFTNVSQKDAQKISRYGEVSAKKVSELNLSNACILDPYSKELLAPSDSKKFSYMVFGGILGNNPAQRRTEKLTKVLPFQTRHLGEHQLSTDTAVYVTKKILDGTPFSEIKFADEIEIEIDDEESVTLPFHYVVEKGRAIISERIIDHIRKEEEE